MKSHSNSFPWIGRALLLILGFLFFPGEIISEEVNKLHQPYYITPRSGSRHTDLSAGWKLCFLDAPLRQLSELDTIRDWMTVDTPTSVQWALHKAGKLPHPYQNQNSTLYRWVEDKLWYYKKEVEIQCSGGYLFLCFDGLDYYSRVWFNGELLGKHEGMFGGPSLEISRKVKCGQKNTIVVEVGSGNRDPEIRKIYARDGHGEGAPVVKGWAFTGGSGAEHYYTLGMWRGVRLEEVPESHIERPYLYTREISDNRALLSLSAEVYIGTHSLRYRMHPWGNAILSRGTPSLKLKPAEDTLSLRLTLKYEGRDRFSKIFPVHEFQGRTWVNELIEIRDPELWWPNGMGKPCLYHAELTLMKNDEPVDKLEFPFGIRTIGRQRSAGPQVEEEWEAWHFIVNGKPVFIRGANWMPADWLLDLPESRYAWLLEMARNAGIQMIRVWGSGIQETNTFYEYCNKQGIMVWQDFQISHCNTPNWPQDVVEAHVMQNIYRLRNQPSLVLWNGGNGMNPYAKDNSTITGITERYVRMYDPSRFYSRSSSAAGNAHLYPDMDPSWYVRLYRYVPFISETGIHSIPDPRNLRKVIRGDEFSALGNMFSDQFAETHRDIIHHFAEYDPSRVPRMLSRASHIADLNDPDLETLSEATQVGAGEFYQVLTDGVLSNYPNTTGLLYWVFNRMWPVFSAIMLVDGHSQPVAPYYFIRRTLEQTHLSLQMERLLWAPGEIIRMEPSVINHSGQDFPGAKIKITLLDDHFKLLWSTGQILDIPPGVTLVKSDELDFSIPAGYRNRFLFITAELFNQKEDLISRSVYWPRSVSLMEKEEYRKKYVTQPQPWPALDKGPWLKPSVAGTKTDISFVDLQVKHTSEERVVLSATLRNKGKVPSFMTRLDLSEDYRFYTSDNFFWLNPGEIKVVEMVLWVKENQYPDKVNVILSSWNAGKIIKFVTI